MKNKSIPISKIARGKVIGKAILKIGGKKSKEQIKQLFLSNEQKELSKEKNQKETAKIIMESLGELKGVSIKIAQQIALSMPFLPPSYLNEISKSFQSVPPLNRALVRKIIHQELGEYPKNIFEEFEDKPFGSASLGQVHRAKKGIKDMAVKIQYAGIGNTIRSDLSMLSFALRRFAKGGNIDHIMKEITVRLYEEVDYKHEAKNLEYFYDNLKHPHITIPKFYPNFSTNKILATSYLSGSNLDDFLASNPSKELKNHYAQTIFDSFFISLYKLKCVHADPNPGNFIFMKNKMLGLIDFGCVKRVNSNFLKSYNNLHLSLIDGVYDKYITKQYLELGMIDKASEEEMLLFYRNVIKPLDSIYIEIFLEDKYKFKSNNAFSKRGFETILKIQKEETQSVHKLNEEYIFLDRTLLGYYALFERMEATIDTQFAKKIMREY